MCAPTPACACVRARPRARPAACPRARHRQCGLVCIEWPLGAVFRIAAMDDSGLGDGERGGPFLCEVGSPPWGLLFAIQPLGCHPPWGLLFAIQPLGCHPPWGLLFAIQPLGCHPPWGLLFAIQPPKRKKARSASCTTGFDYRIRMSLLIPQKLFAVIWVPDAIIFRDCG